MSRTEAEDLILRAVHEAGGVESLRCLVEDIAQGEQWRHPLDVIEQGELDNIWDHLIEVGLVKLDPLSLDSPRYFRLTPLGRERLFLPGTEAQRRRDIELRALYDTPQGRKRLARNHMLRDISCSLAEIALAIGCGAARMSKSLERLTDALAAQTKATREAIEQSRRDASGIVVGTREEIVVPTLSSRIDHASEGASEGDRGDGADPV